MPQYFTRATAAGASGTTTHDIPINALVSPVNVGYYLWTGAGSGEVSASTYFTIDTIQNPDIQPVWLIQDAGPVAVTASNITFPIQGFRFSVAVSGSASYAAGLLQSGV